MNPKAQVSRKASGKGKYHAVSTTSRWPAVAARAGGVLLSLFVLLLSAFADICDQCTDVGKVPLHVVLDGPRR